MTPIIRKIDKNFEFPTLPDDSRIDMQRGITTQAGAEKWGESKGYVLVYWDWQRERVYAVTTRAKAS